MSKEFCEANPNDVKCSCYNVVMRDCIANPNIPGCNEGNNWKNTLTSVIPQGTSFDGARTLLDIEAPVRYYCDWVGACTDDKYKPPEYTDMLNTGQCTWKVNLCASDVNVGESINAKFFRDCSINDVELTNLDSIYSLGEGTQILMGLRTGENAALIAAKNKALQLQVRADQRQRDAEIQVAREDEAATKLEEIEKLQEAYKNKYENKKRLILIFLAVVILVVIAILNIL